MFKSAYIRLTLWYLALVMAISLVFSMVLYNIASSQLADELRRQSATIYNQFPVFHHELILHPRINLLAGDHIILLRLITFNIIVLISAGLASYWLARRTLRPIEIAHEQQKIFTSNVSHELRTPLTALKMESEVALMSNNLTLDDFKKTINSNLEEVIKLEHLINNILRLTRLENEEIKSHFTNNSINKIVDEATKKNTPIASSRDITIIQNLAKDYVISCDFDSLVQLIIIILDNAIKYSSAGQTIEIKSNLVNKQLELIISDHGHGITKESLEHIFDRFYRADKSRNKNTEGYGLGLSIAKMIADVHNINITIASKINHGTAVKLIIPLASRK